MHQHKENVSQSAARPRIVLSEPDGARKSKNRASSKLYRCSVLLQTHPTPAAESHMNVCHLETGCAQRYVM